MRARLCRQGVGKQPGDNKMSVLQPNSKSKDSMTGGDVLAQMLAAHAAGPIFGMGGFQLLPFYEGVRSRGMTHILVNDERSGVFAADAYARVTNRPGICDATLGPGATNLVTGLVESLNAGIPQVVLVGDTNRSHSWKNMTQEARQVEILRPAAKLLIRVELPERIPELVRRAFEVATTGRPGPVVLDIPEDVCHAELTLPPSHFHAQHISSGYYSRRSRPDQRDIERAAALIASAKRPLILVGGGVHISSAHDALKRFAERQKIPIAHTISGKGSIACTHPLSAGVFGRYSRIANDLIETADVLIVIGCKLGEIATKRYKLLNSNTKVIHIEVVGEEIGRTTSTDVALVGDARLALEDLNNVMAPCTDSDRLNHAACVPARMAQWTKEADARLTSNAKPIDVARLLSEINATMPEDGVLVADGGFAAHWSGLLFNTRLAGRHFIANRGFASIGYGIPGSMGAQIGSEKRRVIGVTGDGGANMSIGDLETARRIGAPFVLCVVNNASSGYVKALQHAMYGRDQYQSSDLTELDYASIARSFGCHGIRVTAPEDLKAALHQALENTDTPTVIDVLVTQDPERMLPAADSRTIKIDRGERPV